MQIFESIWVSLNETLREYTANLSPMHTTSKIHHLEPQSLQLRHMSGPRSISIQIRLRVRMKQARLMTIQNRVFARRIRKPENAMTIHYSALVHAQHGNQM